MINSTSTMERECRSSDSDIIFNPLKSEFRQNPYPTYDRLRNESPILRSKGVLVLSRYHDVSAVLKSRKLSVSLIPKTVGKQAARVKYSGVSQMRKFLETAMVFTDNPEHMRLRRLVSQAVSNEVVQALEPSVASRIEKLLEAHDSAEQLEVVRDIAAPLPIEVLCDWMDIDEGLRGEIANKVHDVRQLLDPGMMNRACFELVDSSMKSLIEFFTNHISQPRNSGRDNLITRLLNANIEGRGLTREEMSFVCLMFFIAGTETTQCLIGNISYWLLKRQDQFEGMSQNRSSISSAVEEITRLETPLQFTKRLSIEDCEVAGISLRRNEQILLCLGSANRDQEVFEEAEDFRPDRIDTSHLAFGTGMHSCLGSVLARLQGEQFLKVILEKYCAFEHVGGPVRWQENSLILRGPEKLNIRFSGQ